MSDVYLRVCPECREEYQPHMTRCIECGAALQDKLEGEIPPDEPPEDEPRLPPGDYRRIADGVPATVADQVVREFAAAGIFVKVEPGSGGLRLSARAEDVRAAVLTLRQHGVDTEEPEDSDRAVGAEGGPCPACGRRIEAGTAECPECGLVLGGSFGCEACGAELSPTDSACPACGQPVP